MSVVGGCSDGPIVVKIPYSKLRNKWDLKNPLIDLLSKALVLKDYTSSWDEFACDE